MAICETCGQKYTKETDTTPCPHCHTMISSLPTYAEGQATIVESFSPMPGVAASSSSARMEAQKSPLSIDGYDIISLLGYGGMGSVYLAYDPPPRPRSRAQVIGSIR